MEFHILGVLEVVDAGQLVVVGATKERALLAALVLRANQIVSRERLVEVVWGEKPPATAATTLNTYVSHLRSTLEPRRAPRTPAGLLLTRDPGYLLATGPEQVDALRFERLAAEGSRALAAGDAETAAATLRNALALWRGSALADFVYKSFARSLCARSLDFQHALGDRYGEAGSLPYLGWAAQNAGDRPTARELHEEALGVRRELGDRYGEAWSLSHLGDLGRADGRAHEALRLLEESLAIAHELGDTHCISWSLLRLGKLARSVDDPATAADRFSQGVTVAGRERFEEDVHTIREGLGEVAFARAWEAGRTSTVEEAIRRLPH